MHRRLTWILITLWLLLPPAALNSGQPEASLEVPMEPEAAAGLFAYVHEDGRVEYLADPAPAEPAHESASSPGLRAAVFTWSSPVIEPRRARQPF